MQQAEDKADSLRMAAFGVVMKLSLAFWLTATFVLTVGCILGWVWSVYLGDDQLAQLAAYFAGLGYGLFLPALYLSQRRVR